jgi:hypothetical protein
LLAQPCVSAASSPPRAAVASAEAAARENPFREPKVLVIHAALKSFGRTSNPDVLTDDGVVTVSNSCGYDTAFFEVRDVLIGAYRGEELAAHHTLGEWCEGSWQSQVREYVLFLRWNGVVWEVDRALSSALLELRGGSRWVVEPALIQRIRELRGPEAKQIDVPEASRVDLTNERLEQMGLRRDPDVSPTTAAREAAALCKRHPCWSTAPMGFKRGLALPEVKKFLGAVRGDSTSRDDND